MLDTLDTSLVGTRVGGRGRSWGGLHFAILFIRSQVMTQIQPREESRAIEGYTIIAHRHGGKTNTHSMQTGTAARREGKGKGREKEQEKAVPTNF